MKNLTVKSLYPLALAEGEGVGTAYEYFAKRLALRRWLGKVPASPRLLIAGLPQKYGTSLDFFLLAAELGAQLTVADDRHWALEKAANAVASAQAQGLLSGLTPHFVVAELPSETALPK